MPAPPPQLVAALADRYRLERELGQGGMATVYLAQDLKHHRKVAVKVLRPELAATLGPERFAREIAVAARLQHPHILGLLDSGDADGFFYYVMPYVEGETLRDRLARTGELPVHEAVRLLAEIADALAVAHKAGVVHRDIKPENILLSGRHAMVMDFGIAKAIAESNRPERSSGARDPSPLTSVGVALGTPAYMAPEQAAAEPALDHRVDIYALGVMGYELLTGQTPFSGGTAQQLLAAQVTRAPEPIAARRPSIPPALAAAIMKCLEKRPADRYQAADELVAVLEPLATPSGGMTPTHTQPVKAAPALRMPRWPVAAGAVLLIAVALFLWKPWARAGGQHLDPNLVAVIPFRVAGADPSVQYLRQGMVDLLQAKLTGEGGPRAADTRSVLAAVRDAGGTETVDLPGEAVTGVAKKIGAGRVLQGSIVGPTDHIVISATLLEMPGGATLAQTSVEGPKDSLFVLVDRLTAQLLALGAGAQSMQLSALTTTSLDALRAYLDGQAAYRRGAYGKATPLLERAVELDSTFALALSALTEANGWYNATTDMGRVERLAWQYRSRLNQRDQLFLSIRLGSRYPRETPLTEHIADREQATQLMPESAEAWYYLGDLLFHTGYLSDIPDPEVRARQAFEKAFQLDSLYGGPITHLERLTHVMSDTAAQALWTRRMIALDSVGLGVPMARWDLLQGRRDGSGISAFLARIDSEPPHVAVGILSFNPLDSVTIAHQPELLAAAHRRATTTSERADVARIHVVALWNRGRPAEAGKWVDTLRSLNPGPAPSLPVAGAIWFGGESPDTSALSGDVAELWRLSQGDLAAGDRLVAYLRARAAKDTLTGARSASLFEAWVAVERGTPTADRLVDVADSMWQGYGSNGWSSIQLARLYQAQGRVDRALRAVRRRFSNLGQPSSLGLAESYRLEGKLAAQVGDTADAIRAYRNYLRMRVDPEPSRIPQRDSVRAELAAVGDREGPR